jgi:hypothetical protein
MFASDKHLWPVFKDQRGLQGNATVYRFGNLDSRSSALCKGPFPWPQYSENVLLYVQCNDCACSLELLLSSLGFVGFHASFHYLSSKIFAV